jgi:glucosyl-dolichyl phosphate glucuronosyltransferase
MGRVVPVRGDFSSGTDVTVTIIICTFNRARDLGATLDALCLMPVPSGFGLDVLVVDNGSTDSTPEIVAGYQSRGIRISYVSEPRRGKGNAYNRGLAEAKGDVLVFTDDDVRPAAKWIENLCEPLIAGRADAVAGAIAIERSLLRPWMTRLHRSFLASTEDWNFNDIRGMNGANMAFTRRVLEQVPAFDTELGPGALGFWDEVLFANQLLLAGYKLIGAANAVVYHHFSPDRLMRNAFVDRAEKEGRSLAYVSWHWGHDPFDAKASLKGLKKRLMLRLLRVLRQNECHEGEGCAEWEIRTARSAAYFSQYAVEQHRPRGYEPHGLRKLVTSV